MCKTILPSVDIILTNRQNQDELVIEFETRRSSIRIGGPRNVCSPFPAFSNLATIEYQA